LPVTRQAQRGEHTQRDVSALSPHLPAQLTAIDFRGQG
jgi:hypothetical protein